MKMIQFLEIYRGKKKDKQFPRGRVQRKERQDTILLDVSHRKINEHKKVPEINFIRLLLNVSRQMNSEKISLIPERQKSASRKTKLNVRYPPATCLICHAKLISSIYFCPKTGKHFTNH